MTARVWRADGTSVPVVLKGHAAAVGGAQFSTDGKWVVTASADATARVWSIDIPVLREHLQDANKDCMPPETRRFYLDESDEQARQAYLSCESFNGRPALAPSAQ
jgi:WD40 repeat protein